MKPSDRRLVGHVVREVLLAGAAAVGAFLFFIHGSLYLQAGSAARPLTFEGFLLVTTIIYLFLRLLLAIASLYLPRPRTEYVVCPECGRAYDASAPGEAEAYRRVARSTKPTEKEVMAAILLRRAIDEARRSAQKDLTGPRAEMTPLPGDVENARVPPEEFERVLRQLDASLGGHGPHDRRPRGPAGPPL